MDPLRVLIEAAANHPLQLGIADAIADELLAGPPHPAHRAPAGV